MRAVDCLVAVALTAGVSGVATAQAPNTATPPPQAVSMAPTYDDNESHWTAAGFGGSTFGAQAGEASWDFGGQVGYLWHGLIGAEFLTDFSPSFDMDNLFLADTPNVNSYMANGIVALPLGEDNRYEPYISVGVGAIQLKSDVLTFTGVSVVNLLTVFNSPIPISAVRTGTVTTNQTRFGSNIGGGLMAYSGNIGFRGDLRYYKATVDNNFTATTAPDLLNQALLSGLDFWRANAGIAFRW